MQINAKNIKRAIFTVIGIVIVWTILASVCGGKSNSQDKEVERLTKELKAARDALDTATKNLADASKKPERIVVVTAPTTPSTPTTATPPRTPATPPTTPRTAEPSTTMFSTSAPATPISPTTPANPVAADTPETRSREEIKMEIIELQDRLADRKEGLKTCLRVARETSNDGVRRQAEGDARRVRTAIATIELQLQQRREELKSASPTK